MGQAQAVQLSSKKINLEKEKAVTDKVKSNPKAFYSFANKQRTIKTKIGPLKCGETYESDAKKMAEILSDQYRSVFSYVLDDYSNMYPETMNIPALHDIEFTKDDLIEAMKKVKINSAAGHDHFPSYLLHHFSEELSTPLSSSGVDL